MECFLLNWMNHFIIRVLFFYIDITEVENKRRDFPKIEDDYFFYDLETKQIQYFK